MLHFGSTKIPTLNFLPSLDTSKLPQSCNLFSNVAFENSTANFYLLFATAKTSCLDGWYFWAICNLYLYLELYLYLTGAGRNSCLDWPHYWKLLQWAGTLHNVRNCAALPRSEEDCHHRHIHHHHHQPLLWHHHHHDIRILILIMNCVKMWKVRQQEAESSKSTHARVNFSLDLVLSPLVALLSHLYLHLYLNFYFHLFLYLYLYLYFGCSCFRDLHPRPCELLFGLLTM